MLRNFIHKLLVAVEPHICIYLVMRIDDKDVVNGDKEAKEGEESLEDHNLVHAGRRAARILRLQPGDELGVVVHVYLRHALDQALGPERSLGQNYCAHNHARAEAVGARGQVRDQEVGVTLEDTWTIDVNAENKKKVCEFKRRHWSTYYILHIYYIGLDSLSPSFRKPQRNKPFSHNNMHLRIPLLKRGSKIVKI